MSMLKSYHYGLRAGHTLALACQRWSLYCSSFLFLCGLVAPSLPMPSNGSARAAKQTLVDQKIRYHHSEAGEVFIMWGVNGWYRAPEAQWPLGTVAYNDKNRYPYTPMTREGQTFVVTIPAPVGTTIDYVFNITKNSKGESIDVWDIYSEEVRDYHTLVIPDTIAEAYSIMPLDQKAPVDLVSIGLRWGVPTLLVAICSIGGLIWLRRKFRNPYLDY